MRYPNLRYGNPNELAHYAQFIPPRELAQRLRRSERTIQNYLAGREKLPWWIPEIIRLQNMEHNERLRQMGMRPVIQRLGLVTGQVIEFTAQKEKSRPEDGKSLETSLTVVTSFSASGTGR